MSIFRTIRSIENLHIMLWLLKDLCWVMSWHLAGVIMIMPTLGVAIWITWRCRGDIGELLHSAAVVLWITANSIWMVGEFFWQDHTRHLATVFFVLGLACVAWYYLVVLPRKTRTQEEEATVI